jgi:hypothetical protein
MDPINALIGAGGGIGMILILYIFKYLNTHRIKIISSCCSFTMEEDRTPKTDGQINQIKNPLNNNET